MKKIITSISVLAIVAVAVVGATAAFFNDTETSSGNIFVAGSIDVKVDSVGHTFNGQFTPDSWLVKNLVDEKFFNLEDLKPSDIYNRSISTHVASNPAWLCIGATNLEDEENNINEAEDDAGDVTDPPGELSKNVHILVWKDNLADLEHTPDEPILVNSFFDVFADGLMPLRDSTNGMGPTPIETELLAMSLCGGNHVIDGGTGAVTCDGTPMGDQAQTDSFLADLVIYGEQHRNNPTFSCADVVLP